MRKSMRDIAALKPEALQQRYADVRADLLKLRSQVATGTVPKNAAQIRSLKRTLARILTLQNKTRKTTRQ